MKLEIQQLSIARNEHRILSDLSFSVDAGACVVIQGKNGAGKSSLLAAIMGLEGVDVLSGEILFDHKSYRSYKTHELARSGIFLAHQEPPAIDGLSLSFMARAALEAMCGVTDVPEAQRRIREAAEALCLPEGFVQKALNSEMSGGEKKRAEAFQMLVVRPKIALLDEIDSGVDVPTQSIILRAIEQLRLSGTGFVVVTHSETFVEALKPTKIITL
ncbi:MAG: ATP-binding cassette domain-containing protein [Patescibacteria group bacterium]|jgi:Fe-S cluster assembly ATP-binding protein